MRHPTGAPSGGNCNAASVTGKPCSSSTDKGAPRLLLEAPAWSKCHILHNSPCDAPEVPDVSMMVQVRQYSQELRKVLSQIVQYNQGQRLLQRCTCLMSVPLHSQLHKPYALQNHWLSLNSSWIPQK